MKMLVSYGGYLLLKGERNGAVHAKEEKVNGFECSSVQLLEATYR